MIKKEKTIKIKTISQLKAELDKWFSLYIRKSRADSNGLVKCFTCGKIDNWKQMQCGHYWSRKINATRWDEINCQVQCKSCNIFREGNKPAFTLNLVRKYGEKILETLEIKKSNVVKLSRVLLELQIDYYKKKYKEINNVKLS